MYNSEHGTCAKGKKYLIVVKFNTLLSGGDYFDYS